TGITTLLIFFIRFETELFFKDNQKEGAHKF